MSQCGSADQVVFVEPVVSRGRAVLAIAYGTVDRDDSVDQDDSVDHVVSVVYAGSVHRVDLVDLVDFDDCPQGPSVFVGALRRLLSHLTAVGGFATSVVPEIHQVLAASPQSPMFGV